jgi:Fe2+ transport system protein FeoA
MPSTINMTDLQQGDKAAIFSITSHDVNYLHKLMVFGLMAGAEFELLQKYPCYVLQIGHTQLAVDKKMAQNIMVIQK